MISLRKPGTDTHLAERRTWQARRDTQDWVDRGRRLLHNQPICSWRADRHEPEPEEH